MKLKDSTRSSPAAARDSAKSSPNISCAKARTSSFARAAKKNCPPRATNWPRNFPRKKFCARTCDVSDETQVNELVAFALRELGSLQALVLNAGIYGPMGPTESVSLDEWRRAMDINLYGVLLPCRAVIPHFKTDW